MNNGEIFGPAQTVRKPAERKSCRGQAMVEFALVTLIFFFVAFAVIDFSWLLFNQMNMQEAIREAGRYASTGEHLPNPNSPGVSLSRTASITQVLEQSANGSNVEQVVISSAAGGAGNAGGPGDTVTVRAVCDVPLLTAVLGSIFGTDNRYHFTVSSTFKNEPFPPGQTN